MNLWLFVTVSTCLTFAILLVLVRWIGSTQLTQLTFFNWVAGASMGNIAANMIASQSVQGWLAACYTLVVFTACTIIAAWIALKSRTFRRVANGEPLVLIHKGTILRENLRRSKVNLDVFLMMLREKGYFSYSEIEYAILEPTGNLSILPAQASQSASKSDLAHGPDLSDRGQGPYIELIVDGEIDEDKLRETGKSREWLLETIRELGGLSVADVTYLGVNAEGEVIADLHRKQREPSPPL
ncbi:DUF421 domain-containing protein [Alicyclobacillus contaminans]|uniref:DUF421 domain-containing protein n=1 Tax=Alicyclobacillus contaminans TaxID=392016 RepID=UPI000402B740|nr:DUF421 domain-containing protein [Alicyclobacillus contaminans]GMA49459.1 DUF421 domain-containing protein [Alicyclobacillus contaminans]